MWPAFPIHLHPGDLHFLYIYTHVTCISCTFTPMWPAFPVHLHPCDLHFLYIYTHVTCISYTFTSYLPGCRKLNNTNRSVWTFAERKSACTKLCCCCCCCYGLVFFSKKSLQKGHQTERIQHKLGSTLILLVSRRCVYICTLYREMVTVVYTVCAVMRCCFQPISVITVYRSEPLWSRS